MQTITTPALPEYVCHKKIQAARIMGKQRVDERHGWNLRLEIPNADGSDSEGIDMFVAGLWHDKNKPKVGGYFVLDGVAAPAYVSAEAFEAGYSRAPTMQPVTMALIAAREQEIAQILAGTHPTLGCFDPFSDMFSERELEAIGKYEGPPLRFNQTAILKSVPKP